MPSDLAVYVHFPYCLAKCPYCDFYSDRAGEPDLGPDRYFQLVETELRLLCCADDRLRGRRIVSLYIGGGTPSLASPDHCAALFKTLRETFDIDPDLEWTLEVNPGTAGPETLDRFVSTGINRLSIGVQSFCDKTLQALGRIHNAAQSMELLRHLAECAKPGLAWGIDLMFGVPGQTFEQWCADLKEAIKHRVHHLSVYGLTIHDGTRYSEWVASGAVSVPDEEDQRKMYIEARNRLIRSGYIHYEISNYALPGFESRHNRAYWCGKDYLGLGVSAHSYISGQRCSNPSDLALYRRKIESGVLARVFEEPPRGRARLGEQVMLGLRQIEGIDLREFRSRTGSDLGEAYRDEIDRLIGEGLLELSNHKVRLTEAGLLVADSVMAEFF